MKRSTTRSFTVRHFPFFVHPLIKSNHPHAISYALPTINSKKCAICCYEPSEPCYFLLGAARLGVSACNEYPFLARYPRQHFPALYRRVHTDGLRRARSQSTIYQCSLCHRQKRVVAHHAIPANCYPRDTRGWYGFVQTHPVRRWCHNIPYFLR